MSLEAMTWAWKQKIPPTEKYVLVAIADHANDEDFQCWPSLSHLQRKTGLSRPSVWKIIDRLVERGALSRVGTHTSGTTIYAIVVGNTLTQGNGVTQVSALPGVGNQGNRVGNQGNKLGNGVTPNHKNPKNQNITINPEDADLAERIFSLIQTLNPKHRQPNMAQWANEIRLMRERDHRTHQEILDLFTWANQDSFWKANILSPATLRRQWDKLTIQKEHKQRPTGRKTVEDYRREGGTHDGGAIPGSAKRVA